MLMIGLPFLTTDKGLSSGLGKQPAGPSPEHWEMNKGASGLHSLGPPT
jgi:hypothetical protein